MDSVVIITQMSHLSKSESIMLKYLVEVKVTHMNNFYLTKSLEIS